MSKRLFCVISVVGFLCVILPPTVYGENTEALRVGTWSEPSIDPHYHWTGTEVAYAVHLFGRLIYRDENLHLQPDLAESWKPLDDTTWEFKLRKAKFHDGSDFTAEDVVFSFERVRALPALGSYAGVIASVTEMQVADPHTFILKTRIPDPELPSQIVDISIISKKAATNATSDDFKTGKAVIGTGPYKFVKYVSGKHLIVERFEDYWGEKPAYKRIVFKILENAEARVAALLGGAVDMIGHVPPDTLTTLEAKGFRILKRSSDRIIYLTLNNTIKTSSKFSDKNGKPLTINPLKDIRVRQAISKAIYRKAIRKQVLKGFAAPASQFVPEGVFGYNPEIKEEPFDPAGAKQLLVEAGYPEGFNMVVNGPNDRYFNDAQISEAVAQMLTRIGIRTKADTMTKNEWVRRRNPPDTEFVLYLIGWSGGAVPCFQAQLHTYNKNNGWGLGNGGYSNPEFDQVVEKAARTVNDAEREQLAREAAAMVIGDYGALPLHFQVTIVAARPDIEYKPRADEQLHLMKAKPKE